MSNNAHELSNRLLNALDSNYNVVDMQTVNEIISILEKFNITKELLETTRLGKHVNELRRKTTDPTLARRAKVLVKRWRDLVIPAVASPAHTGSNNRSSAERVVRRLGGTPLTSPALSRQVVSPAVPSPRPPSRPAWGGYESDSQDVILVDDDPASPAPPAPAPAPHAPPAPHKALTPPVKRPPSPEPLYDEKKAKRDKKPKKKRPGHSRAGSGTEATGGEAPPSLALPHGGLPSQGAHPHGAHHAWGTRNGSGRRNGWRRDTPDPYAALVNRLPPAGAKVKTTKELLEQIQSRGAAAPSPRSPASPASPHSPDVMLIEPDPPITVDSPLRNGNSDSKLITVDDDEKPALRPPSPAPPPAAPLPPLEEERPHVECTCGAAEEDAGDAEAAGGADAACPAAARAALRPLHVRALHHALLPGVNGTRAPPEPHRYAVRAPARADRPALFASVVPLYKYSDYADDYCVKNLARVPLCEHLPWTHFAPAPPDAPPPPSPPPLRPYPDDDRPAPASPPPAPASPPSPPAPAPAPPAAAPAAPARPTVEPEMMSLPNLEPSERLKAPILSAEDVTQFGEPRRDLHPPKEFVAASPEHRTVEKTKTEDVDGRALFALCEAALNRVPYSYEQTACAPVVTLPPVPAGEEEAEAALEAETALNRALDDAAASTTRDSLGRPERPALFAEWHECARLGDLVALPYVVID